MRPASLGARASGRIFGGTNCGELDLGERADTRGRACRDRVGVSLAAVARRVAGVGGEPGGDIDQCSNGQAVGADRLRGVRRLGQRQPQREQLALPRGRLCPLPREAHEPRRRAVHTLTIQYDTIDGGKHAYDYLTSYNRTEPAADPCARHSRRASRRPSGPIPADPSIAFANPSSTQVAGQISIWNGTSRASPTAAAIPPASALRDRHLHGDALRRSSSPGAGTSARRSTGAPATAPARSAGSPYHMRLLELDSFGCGNQDRSLGVRGSRRSRRRSRRR